MSDLTDMYANPRAFLGVLQGLGVPNKTALGALGSIAWESGPTLKGNSRNIGDGSDGSDSIGWGQWNGSRGQSLRNIAAQMGTTWSDPAANAAQVRAELTGPYKHVLDQLRAVDDTRAGTAIWTNSYEVPKVRNIDQRYGRALDLGRHLDPSGNYASAIPVPTPMQNGQQVAAASQIDPSAISASDFAPIAQDVSPLALAFTQTAQQFKQRQDDEADQEKARRRALLGATSPTLAALFG